MTKELHLNILLGTVSRYSVVTLVFFTTYIVFQPPSTIIVRKLGPRYHLSAITIAWGATMLGMGFVKNWHALAGTRILLGILEAGFFPSCVYLLSTWYTRYDVGKRYSVFYILGSLASACAGILAYGVSLLSSLIWRNERLTMHSVDANGRSTGTYRMEVDLHHRGHLDHGSWSWGILGTCGLSG